MANMAGTFRLSSDKQKEIGGCKNVSQNEKNDTDDLNQSSKNTEKASNLAQKIQGLGEKVKGGNMILTFTSQR